MVGRETADCHATIHRSETSSERNVLARRVVPLRQHRAVPAERQVDHAGVEGVEVLPRRLARDRVLERIRRRLDARHLVNRGILPRPLLLRHRVCGPLPRRGTGSLPGCFRGLRGAPSGRYGLQVAVDEGLTRVLVDLLGLDLVVRPVEHLPRLRRRPPELHDLLLLRGQLDGVLTARVDVERRPLPALTDLGTGSGCHLAFAHLCISFWISDRTNSDGTGLLRYSSSTPRRMIRASLGAGSDAGTAIAAGSRPSQYAG